MSTIAVFVAIGGASAFAATQLAKNSVGSKQLKNNAVTSAKIKKEAVAGAKIKNGAVSNSKLADGAVSSGKLADGAVSSGKLADGAVTEGKIANDAVTGAKVKDQSLSGSDIQQGTLTSVKAANVFATEFDESAGKVIRPSDPGIKSGGCFLVCFVEFPVNVTKCSASASEVDATGTGTGEAASIETYHPTGAGSVNELGFVAWNDEGNLIAHDFGVTVVCPTT
jgi:hypothetical protein